MNNKIKMAAAVFMVCCLIGCGGSDRDKNKDVNVLVVHSYHIEYGWTRAIDDGIMNVLGNKGYTIKTFFLDTNRNTELNYKIEMGRKAIALVKEFNPDVVITSDDNAQEYFAKYLVNKEHISIVFCGVNGKISTYGFPGNNATGIVEHPFIRVNIDLLKKLTPGVRTYTILTDKSKTSDGFIDYLKELNLPIRVDKIIQTNDFDRWKDEVINITSDAVITYIYHNVKERGKPVSPNKVLAWTIERLTKPTIGFADFAIEGGVLLGNVESGFEHGELAAQKTIEIIEGKKTTEIPITESHKGLILINAKTAAKLGIDIAPLKNIADKIYNR